MNSRVNYGELAMAIALVLAGIAVAYMGLVYGLGTMRHIGPGFFPLALGVLLGLLSLGILVETGRGSDTDAQVPARVIGSVIGSLLVFAFLLERFGLVPATISLIVVASFASSSPRPLPVAASAVLMAAAAVAVFIWGLRLPLRAVVW